MLHSEKKRTLYIYILFYLGKFYKSTKFLLLCSGGWLMGWLWWYHVAPTDIKYRVCSDFFKFYLGVSIKSISSIKNHDFCFIFGNVCAAFKVSEHAQKLLDSFRNLQKQFVEVDTCSNTIGGFKQSVFTALSPHMTTWLPDHRIDALK